MSIPFLDDISLQGNLSASGSLSAAFFVGDGHLLTNLPIGTGTTDALPLSGGTLTGGLTGTSARFTGGVSLTGNLSTAGYIYGQGEYISFPPTKYRVDVGDAINTYFNIDHNLNTEDVSVLVYDNLTKQQVFTGVELLNANSVKIDFSLVPSLDAYRVLIFTQK